jgi:hypothetical protein
VASKAGMDAVESLTPAGTRTPAVQPVAIPNELSRVLEEFWPQRNQNKSRLRDDGSSTGKFSAFLSRCRVNQGHLISCLKLHVHKL